MNPATSNGLSVDPELETLAALSVVRDGAIHNIAPIDLSPLPPLPITSPEDVAKAVEEARLVQRGWAALPLEDRVKALTKMAKTTLERRHEVVELMKLEIGKMEVDAMNEVIGPLDQVTAWASVIRENTKREKVSLNPINFPKKKAYIEHVARGVVAVIAPWNYPVATLFRSVVPALLAGNAVVLKPSEYSTRTTSWFAQRFIEVLPPGVLQIVVGGKETGIALLESGIDACIFTGSVPAGRDVGARCAEKLIPFSAELGGKDAAVVLDDCELDRTLAGLTHWSLSNVGQACGAVEIVYVDRRIADEVVRRLASTWKKLKVGPGEPGDVDISPMCNAKQLALVVRQVQDAKKRGATIVTGGKRLSNAKGPVGFFYEPTLIDHCTPAMEVIQDETFGPVLAIVRVDGAADAIRQINASRYGLTASIWTTDYARAERLAQEINVGVVTINNHAMTGAMPSVPWSGTRDTGTGVANGAASLSAITCTKTVLVDSNSAPELYWMPYDRAMWELWHLLADAQLMKLSRIWKVPFLIKQRTDTIKKFFSTK